MISEASIEMQDVAALPLVNPIDQEIPPIAQQSKFGHMFTIYRSHTQCPGSTAACCSFIALAVFAAIAAGGYIYGATSLDMTQQVVGYVIGGVGTVCAVAACMNGFVHCFSCCAAGHYIPEKDLEEALSDYHRENAQLSRELSVLDVQKTKWNEIVQVYQEQIKKHQTINENLQLTFEGKGLKYDKLAKELNESQEVIENLSQQLGCANERLKVLETINTSLENTIEDSFQVLDELDINTEDLRKEREEWKNDYKVLQEHIDNQEANNDQLGEMLEKLNQGMGFMEKMRATLETSMGEFKNQSTALKQNNDELEEERKQLEKLVQIKSEEFQKQQKAMEQLTESLKKAQALLAQLIQSEKFPETSEGALQEIKLLVDESSEVSDRCLSSCDQ